MGGYCFKQSVRFQAFNEEYQNMTSKSYRRNFWLLSLAGAAFLLGCTAPLPPAQAGLTAAQMDRVGQRIWQNECAGSVAGLTSWNGGEDFASLGIGHFIWYPAGRRGPFEESFPGLGRHLEARGVLMPAWTKGACVWDSKAAFDADKNGPRQAELRNILAANVGLQTEYIMLRLQRAAGSMSGAAKTSFTALSTTPEGMFCLIDYVNFKGEGTNPKERYRGQGWGLMQVLEDMRGGTPAAFAEASKRVLSRRVANSPPERGEQRWLAGWHNRCEAYKRPL
jgi:hypothetical protein